MYQVSIYIYTHNSEILFEQIVTWDLEKRTTKRIGFFFNLIKAKVTNERTSRNLYCEEK